MTPSANTQPAENTPLPADGSKRITLALALLAFYAIAASMVTVWLWMHGLQQVPAARAGVFMVFLPIALIWITVTTLRSVQDLRAEASRLQTSVESMRAAYAEAQAQPSVERKLEEIERDLIQLAIEVYSGHMSEVARRLGIGRSTLYRKVREQGLDVGEEGLEEAS